MSPTRATEEIGADELRTLAGADIVAGFRVPERSVETQWVADRLVGRSRGGDRQGVTLRLGTAVVGVEAVDGTERASGACCTPDGDGRGFRPRGERSLERATADRRHRRTSTPEPPWTHRYRQCVFVRTRSECDLPSALVAVGPFGDVKNYNGRDFYVSWYPVGLVGQGSELELEPLRRCRPAREADESSSLACEPRSSR